MTKEDVAQLLADALGPLSQRLNEVDRAITGVGAQLRPMTQRLDELDRRLSQVTDQLTRLDSLGQQLTTLHGNFSSLDGRLQQIARNVNATLRQTKDVPFGD